MKKIFIKDLKDGDFIEEIFLINELSLRDFKDKPGKYLQLELKDASGIIIGKKWEDANELYELLEKGDLIKIKGKVSQFQTNLQIIIENLAKVESEELKASDFVTTTPKDLNKIVAEIKQYISKINNPFLNQLIKKFFSDEKFLNQFKEAPAGKSWHQAYTGGLAEHTLNVLKICEFLTTLYPEINHDLLLTGALFHDIGKIYEYQYPLIIDYTDEGRLIGHISIQDALITEKIGEIKNFPADLKNQLRHILLSHHGEKEMGSPKPPKTPEAIILHYADNLDAQTSAFLEIIKKTRNKGKTWSEYIRLIDRDLYAGPNHEQKELNFA